MLTRQTSEQQIVSIDVRFIQSVFKNIKTILQQKEIFAQEMKDIGFAVKMTISPKEQMCKSAV